MPQTLLPIFPAEATPVNELISFLKREGTVYYFHGCLPVFSHAESDLKSFRLFTSQLVVNGSCTQAELVRAFGTSSISMKRHVKKLRAGGSKAFYAPRRKRQPRVLTPEVLRRGQELLAQGQPRAAVAKELGIKLDTLSKAVRAGRLVEPLIKKDGAASTKSERSIADSQAGMGMGCTRVVERVCAAVGLLGEAPTRFEPAESVAQGGVLWALPALLANGLLRRAQECFRLAPGYYSLTQILLLLAAMALARVKTLEQLRYQPAGEWGKLLGLDRIPEVRTLREKVKELAQPEAVSEWGRTLAQDWMAAEPEAAGFLYVDGHVRVYHGRQTQLPRRYVARQRLCLRGMTDYWVNDQQGRPFFVISSALTPGLLATLKNDIVPRLLAEVPGQPSEEELAADPYRHRFTLIYDREGYSPEFFQEMWARRIACLTYHKYPGGDWPVEEFAEQVVELAHGESVRLRLAEQSRRLSQDVRVREIRKLTETGHQVSILSTNFEASMSALAGHMFARWSQENFFQYMMHHFAIDRLVEYQLGAADETAKVVNPAYRKLEQEIKTKAGKRSRKLAEFGALALPADAEARRVAAFEQAQGTLREEITLLEKDLAALKAQRKETPKHIRWIDLPEPERFVPLAPTRKQLLDTIKMIAYRAETALASVLRERMARADDTRALLRELFTTEADLIPDEAAGTLTVRLHHLTNRASDEAMRFLAAHLNATETVYPGANLRLVYELVSD